MQPSSKIMGNPSAPLWIVSTSPKKGDNCGPFSTTLGANVIRQLDAEGVPLADIHFDYIWYEPLSAGGIYFLKPAQIELAMMELKDRISKYKPNLILFIGNECLKNFLGQTDMMAWSGHVLWNDFFNCKTLYTFDPFVAYTQNFVDKDDKPGQYVQLLRNHVAKAAEECRYAELRQVQATYTIAPTFQQAKEYLEDMLANATILSYDIEVPEPYSARIIDCIGLASSWTKAICIPFYICGDEGIQRYWRSDAEHYEIYSLVKRLMESDIPKVAQNSQFDTTIMEVYLDIKTNNLVWDTMIAAHNLYCDMPKTLGVLTSLYTNLPYHKYMIHSGKSADRWEYNAADAVANLHVMSGQVKEFALSEGTCKGCKDNKTDFCNLCPCLFFTKAGSHYLSVTNAAIPNSVKMHIAGINVNPTQRDRILVEEETFMQAIVDAFSEALPYYLGNGKNGMKLNPNSSHDKLALFYTILNCPIQLKGKSPSADKKALKSILEKDRRDYVKVIAKALLAYSKSKASILVFRVPLDNGRIRTQYDVAGTDTGRLASRKSDVMEGGANLQNVAKGPQRQMMVPDDEELEEFALVDLYAAEAYLNALDAGELEMIEMISGKDCPNRKEAFGCRVLTSRDAEDYKIHNWMQRETQKFFPEECKKYNYTYKLAKQTIHGLNYGVMPDKMSLESGLPKAVTSWQYSMYHKKFPGIQTRMTRIDNTLRKTHSLSTSLGRRRVFIQEFSKKLQNIAYAWPNQSSIGEVAIIAQNYLHTVTDIWEATRGEKGILCRPTLNTHDGLAIRVMRGMRQEVIPYILKAFHIPLTLNGITIHIPISIGWGDNFNDMVDELVYFYE